MSSRVATLPTRCQLASDAPTRVDWYGGACRNWLSWTVAGQFCAAYIPNRNTQVERARSSLECEPLSLECGMGRVLMESSLTCSLDCANNGVMAKRIASKTSEVEMDTLIRLEWEAWLAVVTELRKLGVEINQQDELNDLLKLWGARYGRVLQTRLESTQS